MECVMHMNDQTWKTEKKKKRNEKYFQPNRMEIDVQQTESNLGLR